jgi:O-antigen ligase
MVSRGRFPRLGTFGALLLGALSLTNWPTYQFTVIGGPIALLYYLLPAITVIPLLVARSSELALAAREPVVIWFVAYVFSGLVWLLIAGDFGDQENRQWRLRLLAFFVFSVALILISQSNHRLVSKMIIACVLLASLNNWIDFVLPFAFVPADSEYSNPGRGAGLYINANEAGMAVIVMTIAALPFIGMRFRAPLLVAMLLGTFPTFSRSAMLFALVVVILAIALRQFDKKQLVVLGILGPALAMAAWNLFEYRSGSGEINVENVQERLDFFSSVGEAGDHSATERRYVAELAWEMFADSPFVGNGLGTTLGAYYGRGTHNMYLMLLAEQGILGGALYLALVLILLHRGWTIFRSATSIERRDVGVALFLLGALLTTMGMFSHNLLEQPSTQFVLAFLVSAAWATKRDNNSGLQRC